MTIIAREARPATREGEFSSLKSESKRSLRRSVTVGLGLVALAATQPMLNAKEPVIAAIVQPSAITMDVSREVLTNRSPPAWQDEKSFVNGCFVESWIYLARLGKELQIKGETLDINVDGRKGPPNHTIAVVPWRGAWWGRDKYFGTFYISDRSPANDPAAFAELAEDAYASAKLELKGRLDAAAPVGNISASPRDKLMESWRAAGLVGEPPISPDYKPSMRERWDAVNEAALEIPGSAIFTLKESGPFGKEIPVLFGRTREQGAFVYDPGSGSVELGRIKSKTDPEYALHVVNFVALKCFGCEKGSARAVNSGVAVEKSGKDSLFTSVR